MRLNLTNRSLTGSTARGLLATLLISAAASTSLAAQTQFAIAMDPAMQREPADGRVLLMLSRNNETEPRFQVAAGVQAIQVFGVDVAGLETGGRAIVDSGVFGYPIQSLADVPPGDYWVQGLLHRYETFHRADGHVVKLPMDRGEGQRWNRAPGNLFSEPRLVRIDPAKTETVTVTLDQVIPAIAEPEDTQYIRHVKIQSQLLTEFWGRPMYLGAHVLVPEGFDEHPEARYPLMIFHGHFPGDFGGFRTEAPDPDLECEYSERFQVECYNRVQQQEAYDFFKTWSGPDLPRYLVIEISTPTPTTTTPMP